MYKGKPEEQFEEDIKKFKDKFEKSTHKMKDKLNYYYGPYEKDPKKPYKHKRTASRTSKSGNAKDLSSSFASKLKSRQNDSSRARNLTIKDTRSGSIKSKNTKRSKNTSLKKKVTVTEEQEETECNVEV